MKAKTIHGPRRRLLVRATMVIAGMVATVALPRPVWAKAAKGDFLYQEQPHDGKKCLDCKHFAGDGKGSGTCAIVEGTVSANGWCQAFVART